MSGLHVGGAALRIGQSPSLRPLPELWVLAGSCRFAALLSPGPGGGLKRSQAGSHDSFMTHTRPLFKASITLAVFLFSFPVLGEAATQYMDDTGAKVVRKGKVAKAKIKN